MKLSRKPVMGGGKKSQHPLHCLSERLQLSKLLAMPTNAFAEHLVFLLMLFVVLCIQAEIQPPASKLPRLISCLDAHGSLIFSLSS